MKKALYIIIVLAILIWLITFMVPKQTTIVGSAVQQGIYPNATLTPGVTNPDITQLNIADTICNPHWTTKSIRPSTSYTNKLKIEQIKQYGYSDTDPSHFEEDHLISLTDAGSPTDPGNLWPEAYPLAKEKDKYEVYVHGQICRGEISLIEGQHRLSTDWYSWYKKAGLDKKLGSATNDQDDN